VGLAVGDGVGVVLGAVVVGVGAGDAGEVGAEVDLVGCGPGDALGGSDVGLVLAGMGEGWAVECVAAGCDRRACAGAGLPAGGWASGRVTPGRQPPAPHALASSLGGCDRNMIRLPTMAKAATPAPLATSQRRSVGVGLRGKERWLPAGFTSGSGGVVALGIVGPSRRESRPSVQSSAGWSPRVSLSQAPPCAGRRCALLPALST
jgi:hypothetical protein